MTDSAYVDALGSRLDRMNASTVVTMLSFAVIVVLAAVALFATSPGDDDQATSTTAGVLPALSGFDRAPASADPIGRQAGAATVDDAAADGSTAPGGEPAASSGTTTAAAGDELGAEASDPDPGAVSPTSAVDESVYFANCSAAEAAGAAPILAGQPGYRAGLDRDGDGVACEVDSGPGATSTPPTAAPTSGPAPTTARPTTTRQATTAPAPTTNPPSTQPPTTAPTTFVLQPTTGLPPTAPSTPD